ncbi:hypothetical protein A2U01_0006403 [Trifolium medium]|uniref:Uncharacterized protein n=1 Tax=Trifolium medium TaxID=97028 RepID=A0A392MDL4_9FABA|nr:hypothetical protein [Trifolium medium]
MMDTYEEEPVEKEKVIEPEEEKEQLVVDENSIPREPQNQLILNKDKRQPKVSMPYPGKEDKKEIGKEQHKKFGGYMQQMEINIPLHDMLQISPPFS